MFFVCWS